MKKIIILLMLIVFCGTVQATMSYNDWGNEYSTNIIGLWNSSDTNQSILLDQVNSNHGTINGYTFSNGTVSGATLTNGKFGSAYNFSGGDTITITTTTPLDLEVSDHMTITAWINQDVDVNGGRIIDRWSEVIFRNTNGELEFMLNSLVGDDRVAGTTTIGINEWVHVAARYNGTHLAVFVNGEEDGADAVSGTYGASAANWVMGSTFNGSMDEMRIWDRALTDQELRENMNSSNPVASQGLVGSWSFEKNHGTNTQDTNHIVNGTIGTAMRFDGVDDYISIPNSTSLNPNELTLCAWFDHNNVNEPTDGGIAKGSLFSSAAFFSYQLRFSSDVAGFYVSDGTTSLFDASTIGTTGWHWYCGTANSTHIAIYKDGTQSGSPTTRPADYDIFTGTDTLIIGARPDGSLSLNGSIDDVILWNKSLSKAQIANLYDSYIGGCVTPVEDLTLTVDTTFCQGSYDLNDTAGNGAIIMGGNGLTLDCNQSFLFGNQSADSEAIDMASTIDGTIRNCVINDYADYVDASRAGYDFLDNTFYNSTTAAMVVGSNVRIIGNTFKNENSQNVIFSNAGVNVTVAGNYISSDFWLEKVFVTLSAAARGWSIYNNTIHQFEAFDLKAGTHSHKIYNNTITGMNTSQQMFDIDNARNISYFNNSHRNGFSLLIWSGVNESFISNNTWFNNTLRTLNTQFIDIGLESRDITIDNNNLSIADIGIRIRKKSKNINITNNYIGDMRTEADAWSTGIYLKENASNIRITGNTIHYANLGILMRNASEITISNNKFNQMSLAERWIYGVDDSGEALAAIFAAPSYKGYLTSEQDVPPLTKQKMDGMKVVGLTISGNTFDKDVQTFLKIQGATGLTHDLTDYWYRALNPEGSKMKAIEFYNSNNWTELMAMRGNYPERAACDNAICNTTNLRYWHRDKIGGSYYTSNYINYSMSKSITTVISRNDSANINITWNNGTKYQQIQLEPLATFYITPNYCQAPIDNMVITSNTILCGINNYNINDTGDNGAIIIAASNVKLDGNGAELRGDRGASSKGITFFNREGVEVTNITIKDYYWGIQSTQSRYADLNNLDFTNNTNRDLSLSINHSKIRDSTFNDSLTSVYLSAAWHNNVTNNIFTDVEYNVWIDNAAQYNLINNNNITGCEFSPCIDIKTQSNYNRIEDNYINNVDRAIRTLNSNHTKIERNNISDSIRNIDRYNNPITLGDNSSYTMIRGNRFTEIGCIGVLMFNVGLESNTSIINNYFDHVSISNMTSRNVTCENEPQVGVHIAILDRTWNTNNPKMTPKNGNITLSNNNFGPNTQVFLRDQGGIDVTHDLTGYWSWNFSTLAENVSQSVFYVSDSFDSVSNVNDSYVQNYIFGEGYQDEIETNYWLNREHIKIRNIDGSNHTFNISFSTSNNQVFNGSSETPTSENAKTFTESIPVNNRTLVFSFDVDSPRFSKLPKNLTNISHSFNNNQFEVKTSGTGTIGIKTLGNIKSATGFFEHRSLGSLVTESNADPYEFPMTASNTFIPYTAPSNGDDPSSPSSPAGPFGNDPEVEIIPDNVSQLKPITKLESIKENLLNSTKKLKEFIIGSTKKPSSFIENWKDLNLFDRVLLIGSVVFIIVFVATVIWMIPKKKKLKKKKKKTEDEEAFI